mmetsp:Transcript_12043/g.28859  ORF Transcript_12043/g.28859 Transcript_12043/m.28859 type:complete len:200 (+) Transcript_12043:475-1074(+)
MHPRPPPVRVAARRISAPAATAHVHLLGDPAGAADERVHHWSEPGDGHRDRRHQQALPAHSLTPPLAEGGGDRRGVVSRAVFGCWVWVSLLDWRVEVDPRRVNASRNHLLSATVQVETIPVVGGLVHHRGEGRAGELRVLCPCHAGRVCAVVHRRAARNRAGDAPAGQWLSVDDSVLHLVRRADRSHEGHSRRPGRSCL